MSAASQEIDAIIAKSNDWRGEMLARLRGIILSSNSSIIEEVYRVDPEFAYVGSDQILEETTRSWGDHKSDVGSLRPLQSVRDIWSATLRPDAASVDYGLTVKIPMLRTVDCSRTTVITSA